MTVLRLAGECAPGPGEVGMLRLQSWLSPMLPVGAFSFSHSLESAVEQCLLSDGEGLADWLDADLRHGTAWNDAVFFSLAWRAARAHDHASLIAVAEHAAAYRGTAELALEAAEQGRASLEILSAVWPDRCLTELDDAMRAARLEPVPSVVLAVRMAREDLELEIALASFLQAYCSNLVAAAVRLMRLGQTAGQAVIRDLEEVVLETSRRALISSLDDLGSSAIMVDMMSMSHETQKARLFRS